MAKCKVESCMDEALLPSEIHEASRKKQPVMISTCALGIHYSVSEMLAVSLYVLYVFCHCQRSLIFCLRLRKVARRLLL